MLYIINILKSKNCYKPKNVFAPVNSTVPSTSPRTTVEPILQLSPWYIVTGRDSPVKAAWSTSIYLNYDMIILNNFNKM